MGITLSSPAACAAAIRGASHVQFGSFVLGGGAVRNALASAARGGADVDVVLARQPYATGADGARENARTAAILRDAGAHVTLAGRTATWFHLKGAVCDGVAYLDDRNFPAGDRQIVVADDDPRDVALVGAAIHGRGSTEAALATDKADALAKEAALIRNAAGMPVTVETETLGPGAVTTALRLHAQRGDPTTLIVPPDLRARPRMRAMLEHLRRDGVTVREGGAAQKLAIAGDTVWLGSANASYALRGAGEQIDWGLTTREPEVVAAVKAALARDAA